MSKPFAVLAALASAFVVTACEKVPEAPYEKGVCFHAVPEKGNSFRFNAVKKNVQSIEYCAAELEGMRVRFLRMGSQNRDIVGAYQGSFLVITPAGIFRRERWNGNQYLLMVRTGDGRLAQPGAVPDY
jgi:hypothetical protein